MGKNAEVGLEERERKILIGKPAEQNAHTDATVKFSFGASNEHLYYSCMFVVFLILKVT